MTHKSAQQPLCRWCGKRIAKHTTMVRFKEENEKSEYDRPSEWQSYRYGPRPKTKTEAQRLVNGQITSIRRRVVPVNSVLTLGAKNETHDIGIDFVMVWDGENYKDGFFCNGDHARSFGYAAALGGYAMPAYLKAMDQ